MEATFVLDAQEDHSQFAEWLTNFFAGKAIRIRIEEVSNETGGQQHLFKRMEALRLLTEQVPTTIPPDTDLNDLIDEVNKF